MGSGSSAPGPWKEDLAIEIDSFLKSLSSGDPVPGGGSVAGLSLAMGASLLVMVCELTLGREKFAAVEADVRNIKDRAESIRDEGVALMDRDATAFSRVSAAMKLPRGTDDEKAARRQSLQLALKGAVEPPLETMHRAAEAMDLAVRLAPIGNPSAVSDVGSGAHSIAAAFHAAELNVEINLAAIRDEVFVEDIRAQVPPAGDVGAALRRVSEIVRQSIAG